MQQPKASRTILVTNSEGLHARAATLVAELVRRFEVKVELTKGSERVEGTEVLQILSLGAAQGEQLVIEATGESGEEVLDALVKLFASNFAEDGDELKQTESQS